MGSFVLALDQGTTSSRAIVFDREGRERGRAQREFRQIFPRPGWVEHDPEEIWASQVAVAVEAVRAAGIGRPDLAGIGITNQRETTVVWDRRTGAPVCNAIVWQDRRTAEACDRLKASGAEGLVRSRAGLPIDAYFSATKAAWILDHVPGARDRAARGELAFGTIDSWLLWKLTSGRVHATDASNASRTMLFNIRSGDWDDELLGLVGVPRVVLPEVVASSGRCAEVVEPAELAGVPVTGIAGDQQAALFGQGCHEPGMSKNTYGTGCFLLQNTGERPMESASGLVTTVAWRMGAEPPPASRTRPPPPQARRGTLEPPPASKSRPSRPSPGTSPGSPSRATPSGSPEGDLGGLVRRGTLEYALEGSVFIGGAIVQWLRDGLGIIRSSGEVEALAASVPDNGGVVVVPALAGLGAPHWDAGARGLIIGLTRGTTKGHLARAALEGIAFEVADLVDAMARDSGARMPELRVDGGASENGLLMQFQADVLGMPVVRSGTAETTALGAAYLAGIGAWLWKDARETGRLWRAGARFEPRMNRSRVERMRSRWGEAVGRAKGWEGERA